MADLLEDAARQAFEAHTDGWSFVIPWDELAQETREVWINFTRQLEARAASEGQS